MLPIGKMLPIGQMLLIGKMLPIGQMLLIGKMLPIGQMLLIGRMLLILPAPAVGAAPHDISPPLDIQLVLELKVGVLVAEGVQVFPCRRCPGLAFPVDKHLTDAPSQAGTHHDEYWAVEAGMLEGRPPTSLTAQHESRHGVWRDEGAQDEQQRR
jgi:hypothetical protein